MDWLNCRWQGTARPGALAEARAHLALASDDAGQAEALFLEAADLFDRAGQPLDAARCREGSGKVQSRQSGHPNEQGDLT